MYRKYQPVATVLVTGCNRGIGLELSRQYAARGDSVIGACRTASDELGNTGARVIEGIDVGTADGVGRLAASVGRERIDILVNNAGILRRDSLDTVDEEDMIEQYRVNTIGPLLVTRALVDNLGKGSKVGIVSSRVGSIADNSSGGNYGYRCSKAAVNMVGMNLHHELSPRGIAVLLLHPGYVKTGMTGGSGDTTAAASASGLIARLDELELATSGSFRHAEGYDLPW